MRWGVPRIRWFLGILLLGLLAVGMHFWWDFHATSKLIAMARAQGTEPTVNSRAPKWLLDWAKKQGCEGYLVWLNTDMVVFELHGLEIDDSWLRRLSSRRSLRTLSLNTTQVTDAGLLSLQSLNRLEYLDLARTQITDSGLESLKKLPSLRALDLSETQLTDRGLEHLAEMPALERLLISRTRVTSAGLERLLEKRPRMKFFGP